MAGLPFRARLEARNRKWLLANPSHDPLMRPVVILHAKSERAWGVIVGTPSHPRLSLLLTEVGPCVYS
jgi:hypothetical protein